MRRFAADDDGLAEAVRALQAGKIVAYPTETVYGLGVDPFNEEALLALFDAKGRGERYPVLLIVADEKQLGGVVSAVSPGAQRCIDAFWPGPLSLLFPKRAELPGLVSGGGPKVCVRQTAHRVAQALCREFGGALVSTSANPSGATPALSIDEINLPEIGVGLDAGQLQPSQPSTVFDPDTGMLYREGVIPRSRIEQVVPVQEK